MRIAIAILVVLGTFVTSVAQEGEMSKSHEAMHAAHERPHPGTPQGENLQVPEGWQVRLDKPDDSVTISSSEGADIYFVNMTPGWHITPHKSAIYYHPASTADGSYTARSGFFLLDPGDRDREGFGMFVGGKKLDSDEQEYVYFLLRNTGDFLIKKRTGTATSVLVDWTKSDAIKVHPHDDTQGVQNNLEVVASDDSVTFAINGTEVAQLSSDDVDVNGIVGFRVNHGLNLHVSDLSVEM